MKKTKIIRFSESGEGHKRGKLRPLLILCVALGVTSGALVVRKVRGTIARQARVYAYDVTDSYRYDFISTNAISFEGSIVNGSVRLPPVDEGEYTAFLKVDVQSTFKGRYIQPSIEMECGDLKATEYVERGAQGTRYLNISSFTGGKATEIVLKGNHVKLDEQPCELFYFKNITYEKPTVLVVAPHPDDAEIAAYGFYSEIKNTYIITVTAGEAGDANYNNIYQDQVAHYLKKGELRTWNSISVPMLCGIPPEQAVNLGFFDGTLLDMYRDKNANVSGLFTETSDINTFRKQNISSLAQLLDGSANWSSLVNNMSQLLEKIKPDIIVAPYPALDSHPDHKLSSIALFEAIKRCGLKEGRLYLYTNHCVHNEYYPYGPRGSEVSLPPNFQNGIYYSSLYSHPLSPDKQKDKMFSLEAMHDLRQTVDRRFSKSVTWKSQLRAPIYQALGFDTSYYRRAVRRHELFFVIEMEDIYDQEKLEHMVAVESEIDPEYKSY